MLPSSETARSSSISLYPNQSPAAGQVLVKTLACGICGSDLHAAQHGAHGRPVKPLPAAARRWSDARHRLRPRILRRGARYGPGTRASFKPGTRVCLLAADADAGRVQGIGYSNDIAGGFAERMLLSEPLLLEVPNGLPAEHAP